MSFFEGFYFSFGKKIFYKIAAHYIYSNVKKVEEHYNRHTQTYTTRVNGRSVTRTRVYYSWDYHDSWDIKCKEISFLGIKFKSNKINIPYGEYIETIKESSRVRFKYYGVATKHTGTIFTELKDGTVKDNTSFYKDMKIDEVLENLTSGVGLVVFWIFWILLIGVCVFGFYYIDNEWLE